MRPRPVTLPSLGRGALWRSRPPRLLSLLVTGWNPRFSEISTAKTAARFRSRLVRPIPSSRPLKLSDETIEHKRRSSTHGRGRIVCRVRNGLHPHHVSVTSNRWTEKGIHGVSYCTGDSHSSTYDIRTPPYLQYARLLDPSMQSMQETHPSTDSKTCLPDATGGNEPMLNYQSSIPQCICNY